MKATRNILSSINTSLLSFLAYFYIRFTYLFNLWQVEGYEKIEKLMLEKKPVIIAFWHGRLAMMPNFAKNPANIHVMISLHRDGEFIARTIRHFGLQLIRGSTERKGAAKKRGGRAALKRAMDILKDGGSVCITPDGPRGPRMRITEGVAALAQKTGAPVYMVTTSSSMGKNFNSWDRFLLPYPFGKSHFICEGPVLIAKNGGKVALEKGRKEIENQLNNITHRADELAGRAPVTPA